MQKPTTLQAIMQDNQLDEKKAEAQFKMAVFEAISKNNQLKYTP